MIPCWVSEVSGWFFMVSDQFLCFLKFQVGFSWFFMVFMVFHGIRDERRRREVRRLEHPKRYRLGFGWFFMVSDQFLCFS